jgi:hypothetical protein
MTLEEAESIVVGMASARRHVMDPLEPVHLVMKIFGLDPIVVVKRLLLEDPRLVCRLAEVEREPSTGENRILGAGACDCSLDSARQR